MSIAFNYLKYLIKERVHPRFKDVFASDIDLYVLDCHPDQYRGPENNLERIKEPWHSIEKLKITKFLISSKENIHFMVTPVYWKEIHCNVQYKSSTTYFIWNIMHGMASLKNFKSEVSIKITELDNVEHQQLKIEYDDGLSIKAKIIANDDALASIIWTVNFRVDANFHLSLL
ncbi:hypothetical protein C1645_823712 [Glomus cerebriforme]|uniref:Uncharacterized protein n=1 Tax=Glomus cerebriforme TaxID=658196 RepID=A0A397SYP3_9GLOM|nr:hypothetical protein C1645_823712 [Glomus cerebriforme]